MRNGQLFFLLIAVIAMLIVAAFTWDSVAGIERRQRELAVADADVRAQEERVIAAAAALPQSDAIFRARQAYEGAASVLERREAFNNLAAAIAGAQVSEAGKSQASYEIAGALNRRAIADRHYQEGLADMREYLGTFSGMIGGQFVRVKE